MKSSLINNWSQIQQAFRLSNDIEDIHPFGNGHINDTFLVPGDKNNGVLQRLNTFVFQSPSALQANFDQIAAHISALSQEAYPYHGLSCFHTIEGKTLCQVEDNYWRLMAEIPDTRALSSIENAEQAYSAAKAVGSFDKALKDLPVQNFKETILGFFDCQLRLSQLRSAIKNDSAGRLKSCQSQLALVEKYAFLADWQQSILANNQIPLRITHNDTKVTNILFQQKNDQACAVIDWDTIMPGLWLYDFGDMARSFSPTKNEDGFGEQASDIRFDILQATTQGYLEACADDMGAEEKASLLKGAQLIIYMLGVRFLTDYLNGDVYFKTLEEHHNLTRSQTQFELVEALEVNGKNWQQKLQLV